MATKDPVTPLGSAEPSPGKRQNPVANQMSRRDSLQSLNEFGTILTGEQQAKARLAIQNTAKPGPLHQLLNIFNFASKEK